MPQRNVLAAGALVCLIGLGRLAWFDLWVRPRWVRGAPIDDRYAEVLHALPATDRLGYLTDEPMEGPLGSEQYTQALYALAPRQLLLEDRQVDLWLAEVADPHAIDRLCSERGLTPIQVFSDGHRALLRRRNP